MSTILLNHQCLQVYNMQKILVFSYRCYAKKLGPENYETPENLTAIGLEPRTTYFLNEHSTIWPNG